MISKTLVTSASILAQLDSLNQQAVSGDLIPQTDMVQKALGHPELLNLLASVTVITAATPEDYIRTELKARRSYFGLGIQLGIALAEARQMEELLSPCQS